VESLTVLAMFKPQYQKKKKKKKISRQQQTAAASQQTHNPKGKWPQFTALLNCDGGEGWFDLVFGEWLHR
jgi:hypothetical protein